MMARKSSTYGKKSTALAVSTGASSVSAGAGVTCSETAAPNNSSEASMYVQLTPASVSLKPNSTGSTMSPKDRETVTETFSPSAETTPSAMALSSAGIRSSIPAHPPVRTKRSANANLPLKFL